LLAQELMMKVETIISMLKCNICY